MFEFWTEFFNAQFKIGEVYKGYVFKGCHKFDEWTDFYFEKGNLKVISSLDFMLGNSTIITTEDNLSKEIIQEVNSVEFLLGLLDL
jgi:hypothetical protein